MLFLVSYWESHVQCDSIRNFKNFKINMTIESFIFMFKLH